jgi:hypothetical protein
LQDENSLVILTYNDVIKVRVFATRSVGGNVYSAPRWAFMVAFVDALFD